MEGRRWTSEDLKGGQGGKDGVGGKRRTGGQQTGARGHGKAAGLHSKSTRKPVKGYTGDCVSPLVGIAPDVGGQWMTQDTSVDIETG